MSEIKSFEIAGHKIGRGNPCFFIAEAGVNHGGDVEKAKSLIDAAVKSGATSVKFQTFRADLLAAPSAPKAVYQAAATGAHESQADMLRDLELTQTDFHDLKIYCESQNIIFLSSPFDEYSVDMLNELDVPAYKIPSGETINLPLLKHIGNKHKPVILSTGMSYLNEITTAIETLYQTDNHEIAILHCTSNYPAMPKDINLNAMDTIRNAFKLPVGFSDHTTGIEIPLAAVAMGACIVEKHFTLDRNAEGPDHKSSIEPPKLTTLIQSIRNIELAFGNGIKKPANSELSNREIARKSVHLKTSKNAGETITESDLISLRPSGGIPPSDIQMIIGQKVVRLMPEGSILHWDDLK